MSAHRTAPHHPPVDHRRGRWAAFVHRYGWRAYALPVLSVVTVASLVHSAPSSAAGKNPSSARAAGHTGTGSGAGQQASGRSSTTGSRSSVTPRHAAAVKVEGRTGHDAAFVAGSTPAPVVIHLGNDAVSCATNTYRQLVLVSISKQHLWACEGSKQVTSTAVTTGATVDHDQTPLGSWRVQGKQRNRYLVGPGYRDYVHYWVPFNGDFGLHDASWQTMPFGSQEYRVHGSHGCVHVPADTMRWLYRWASVGNTVVTVEA